MVSAVWAIVYRTYRREYAEGESNARSNSNGIWAYKLRTSGALPQAIVIGRLNHGAS